MTVRDAPAALAPLPAAVHDWAALLDGATPQQLAETWLDGLWRQLPQPLRAVVLLDDGQGQLRSAASLPRGASLDGLAGPVGRAAGSGQPLLDRVAGGSAAAGSAPPAGGTTPAAATVLSGDRWIAVQPAVLSGRVRIAVCVELGLVLAPEAAAAQGLIQWGLGWLVAALSGDGSGGDAALHLERSRRLFDLTLATLSQPTYEDACLAAVNALAQRHDATLVQLGVWREHRMHVEARSGAAWHDARTHLVQQAERAMSEAADDGVSVRLGPAEQAAAAPTAALGYAREAAAGALAIVLLRADDQLAGALMLERATPFGDEEIASLEAQALLLGPVLHTRREAQRGLGAHARDAASSALRGLTGSSRPAVTAGVALAVLLVAGAALWPVTWRVTAPSTLEGQVQRAAVAPYQGFIRAAHVRAGDIVKAGQPLAVLDDRDLQLEKVRFQAELEMAQRKEREAMASGNRVDQRLAAAQGSQAGAQLDLTLDKLRRVAIVAPFDGVVVRGDLSQQLGSPVEQGKVLFELAPLDSWRVILRVDERDAAHVHAGQKGEIVLASLPGVAQPLTVKRVTAVATAEEGRNFFRVEAELAQKTTLLRPGMEGVAKVDAGERSLLWVATHRLVDWLRLAVWEWRP